MLFHSELKVPHEHSPTKTGQILIVTDRPFAIPLVTSRLSTIKWRNRLVLTNTDVWDQIAALPSLLLAEVRLSGYLVLNQRFAALC